MNLNLQPLFLSSPFFFHHETNLITPKKSYWGWKILIFVLVKVCFSHLDHTKSFSKVFSLLSHKARGTKITLALDVLTNIWKDFILLNNKIRIATKFDYFFLLFIFFDDRDPQLSTCTVSTFKSNRSGIMSEDGNSSCGIKLDWVDNLSDDTYSIDLMLLTWARGIIRWKCPKWLYLSLFSP